MVGDVVEGTIRIKLKDLTVCERKNGSWKKVSKQFPRINQIVQLFKAHNNLDILIDKKNTQFLKGQLSPEGKIQGARINILPDNTKIDKAYSLFADHLTVHDQSSDEHWDVLYQNPGGTWSYCYSLEKRAQHKSAKYKKVHQFDKAFPKLIKNVSQALKDKNDDLALPMYTLLKTKMRIGNEIYYKLHHHKGLSTLKKKNIKIYKNKVEFKFVGKDGVPQDLIEEFPKEYLQLLRSKLSKLKNNDFVFTNNNGHPLSERCFKSAFKRYCGKEFYPHLVRSHFATMTVNNFIKGKKALNKKEVDYLYLKIAHVLGHKKFLKKENAWKECSTVTINHYIEPKLVERVKELLNK
jgi:hypothetical protein